MALRRIVPNDHFLLREIYADAIESQARLLYSQEQVQAWAALATLATYDRRAHSDLAPGDALGRASKVRAAHCESLNT